MFEIVKLGRSLSKEDYKQDEIAPRTALLEAQITMREQGIPVLILVSGLEGAGKGEVVNRLNEWLDTRGVQTFAFWDETDEERQRPRYWRYWRTMPGRGEIAIHFGGWYLQPIEDRFNDRCDDDHLERELKSIADTERMLVLDGGVILKFWFHLDEKTQRARLKKLARDDHSRWKMLSDKTKFSNDYARFEHIGERVIRLTDTGFSPWYLVEATDPRYRDMTVGRTLLAAMLSAIEQRSQRGPAKGAPSISLPDEPSARLSILDQIDLTQTLSKEEYKESFERLSEDLNRLAWMAYTQQRSTVLVFEGWDAAGKGGAIRRLTQIIDARLYRSIPIAAPTDEEKAHHYLWRFWRQLPRAGRITIYDRSWYGRVLVERVEGFASSGEWRRAYEEINRFEEELTDAGIIVGKFWIHISQEEQLRRFKEREAVPYKQHKITEEDWRNRERWEDYTTAVNEMVMRTSTEQASWTTVAGNDKRYARIQVLRRVRDLLNDNLRHE